MLDSSFALSGLCLSALLELPKIPNGFYNELRKGDLTIAEALRNAQVSLIRSKQFNHPYYWSAFFAIGNGI